MHLLVLMPMLRSEAVPPANFMNLTPRKGTGCNLHWEFGMFGVTVQMD